MSTHTFKCGLDAALALVGGKWKFQILYYVAQEPRRFGELRRLLEGISEKVLIQQLRVMEGNGLVARHDFQELPLRVEYSVTPFGTSLAETLVPLCEWGDRNMSAVKKITSQSAQGASGQAIPLRNGQTSSA